jgi:S-adenosylmethionine:tRNA ribosyltransferase-isomerase
MDIELFDYELPESLIAQEPSEKRDASRLMVLNRAQGSIAHRTFSDLPEFLYAGDVLVFNNSKVIPARLFGAKDSTGAAIELLLANPLEGHDMSSSRWLALARPARRLKAGDKISFSELLSALVLEKFDDGTIAVELSASGSLMDAIEAVGKMPLPPYIRRAAELVDSEGYQTVYAEQLGSVAAPTAGLHFTPELLEACRKRGVLTASVTLHVGLGTFRTVQVSDITEHHMHTEWYHIDEKAAEVINLAHFEGRRVICVGTTSARTIESAAEVSADGLAQIKPGWNTTDIFIYPGYKFKMVDALLTNFHLPKSTLLMLISALYNREQILAAYQEAVANNYRFFSYGDAMLII